jgi:hypothetical protein
MPTRPRMPRDKAKVELAVQIALRWVLARLRDQRFFSLAELNVAIRALVDELKDRLMRKLGASRREFFETIDRPALMSLPSVPYRYAPGPRRYNPGRHGRAAIRHFYPVPSGLIRQAVEVRTTQATIEGIPSRIARPLLYGPIRLEAVCRRGHVINAASYRSIAPILKTGLDKAFMPDPEPDADAINHGNIRGRGYYL